MKAILRYSRLFERTATLLVAASLFATVAMAQTELQIMVSGPWSYVPDPGHTDRISLVAPGNSVHHKVYIFGGINAADFATQTEIKPGVYKLDFDPSLKTAYSPVPMAAAVVSTGTIKSTKKLSAILTNAASLNYVISLPAPNEYSTYVDPNGLVDGYSESKISMSRRHVSQQSPLHIYTTWMVLHYSLTSLPASLHETGSGTGDIATTGTGGKYPGGISIVLGDPSKNPDDDQTCDHVSFESFKERNSLWGLKGYARFPKLDAQGHQMHHQYDYVQCSDSDARHPSESVGGADCHTAPMSINNAVPQ